ncbi:MAG: drug/metabolite transporter (DMT)-like permease [Verrucomicrobiales bacterium]|jgi:drug/metabolite transporter (DMT)-like permease
MPGWAWAVIAGASFGISQLSNRGLNREMDALRATTAMVTALFGGLIVASVVTGAFSDLGDITLMAVVWFALAALLHFLAGWTLFAFSQQQIGPSRTAAILSVNPVMAAIIAWLVLSEDLRPITWVGVLTVTAGVAIVTTARLTGGRWSNPSLALTATVFFSVSPLFVRWGLDMFDHPLLGLTVGMAFTVPAMHVASRLFTGMWVSVPRGLRRWLFSGGFAAAIALTAQWSAFALIPVGAAISLQQLNTPLVLFAGPILLAAPAERATPRLVGGTVLIIAGSVLVALFGRSL